MDPSNSPKPSQLSTLSKLWGWLSPYRFAMVGAVVALLLSSAAELALGLVARYVVNHGFTPERNAESVWAFAALFGIVGVYAIATFGRVWFVKWLGERVVADVRKGAFRRLLELSPAYYDKSRTSEALSWIAADASVLQMTIAASLPGGLRSVVVLIGGAILLVVSSPKLALIILLTLPVLVVIASVLGRLVREFTRAAQDRFATAYGRAEQSLGAIKIIQAFTAERHEEMGFDEAIEQAFVASRRQFMAEAAFSATVVLFLAGLIAGVLWAGANDVAGGAMSMGDLVAFAFYVMLTANALASLSVVWAQLQRAAGASERLFQVFDLAPEIAAPQDPAQLPTPLAGEIKFNNVQFAYPTRPEIPALDAFCLDIRAGETIALVGATGCGKSTVFNLLLRFYDPNSGSIAVDGVELTKLDPHDLRSQISYVPQDPVMFDGSVEDNLRLGRDDASDEEVEEATRVACALEFVQRLPEGFKTRLGERGSQLSGGQRQRLAIARAVLRESRILLFDEATSSLDSATEQLVQQALVQACSNRTAMIIAHRLNTVRQADRIVVMEEGRVTAVGRHQELLARSSHYARFARLQVEGSDALPE